MAAISRANIRLVGSHAGVAIGEDGPSQMALEDLAMYRAEPNYTVLYPSDAVCAERLLAEMAYHPGPAYMRTSRPKTPVIYDNEEQFPIGGLKVVAGHGWFAARPSGTEKIYKIYAESFKGQSHLDAIVLEAQAIVANALERS